jgi:flavin reductase (DIM6/NTAB) family NADH-FMN oxidoreductase RutF
LIERTTPMKQFTIEDLQLLEHQKRANLINSCTGYKSANLISTQSKKGITNVAVFNSVTHFGSNPAILGFVLRPTNVPRNTYDNIKETGYYTINHITNYLANDAHHTSAKYAADQSEYDHTDLFPEYKNRFMAPYVMGSPVQIGLKYLTEYHIKENDTLLILGSVQELYIKDNMLQQDGFIDLTLGNVATIIGLDGYAIPKSIDRKPYQRPKYKLEKE